MSKAPSRNDVSPRTFAILALGATAFLIFRHWFQWPGDLAALYYAADAYAAGEHHLIYSAPEGFFGRAANPQWVAAAEAHGGRIVTPYLYPPLWAWVAAPVAAEIPPPLFFRGILVIQSCLVVAAAVLAARLAGATAIRQALLTLLVAVPMAPFLFALAVGQLEITVAFLTLAAFLAADMGRGRMGGLFLGVAAALKVSPILLVWVAWRLGHRQTALWAVLVSGGLAALSFAATGVPLHLDFLARMGSLSDATLIHRSTSGLERLIARFLDLPVIFEGANETVRVRVVAAPDWLRPLTTALMLAGIIGWSLLVRRSASLLLGVGVMIYLFGPLGWMHYLMVPVILMAAMIWTVPWGRVPAVAAASLLLVSFLPIILAPPTDAAGLILPVLHMIWACGALAFAVWWDRQTLHAPDPSL